MMNQGGYTVYTLHMPKIGGLWEDNGRQGNEKDNLLEEFSQVIPFSLKYYV